uniref:Uncharacterized protein n=1 Tax=Lactuca sativa TaxID=4236 RepID=A0A9R1XST9_LACSA|nr:hypothetical protein LSAT_V11C100025830 [Lactuca sativa]
MFEGMGPKNLKVDLFIPDEDHLEAIYLLGMIYISRGPHQYDEGLQLRDAYFGWTVPHDVDHRLMTNNITFQCEDPRQSVKGAFVIGHEKDEDRLRYCVVCHWYVEYGRFCIFLKI